MAVKSVATGPANTEIDWKQRFHDLESATNSASLDLLQIKSVARLVSEDHDFNKQGFPSDIYGGVLAILTIAKRAYDDLSEAC